MKILLVEDDPIAQKIAKSLLEQQGHQVLAANDGTQALHLFQIDPVDVVISDWHMPEMDGIELCQMIRTISKSNYTYFIMVSASQPGLAQYAEATAPPGRGTDHQIHFRDQAVADLVAHLLLLQKNPQRQQLLAADRDLHHRNDRFLLHPRHLPHLLRRHRPTGTRRSRQKTGRDVASRRLAS